MRMMPTGLPLMITLAVTVAVAGCGPQRMYSGTAPDKSQVASIQGKFVPLRVGLSKVTVIPVAKESEDRPLVGYAAPIKVKPGEQHLYTAVCGPSASALSCRHGRVIAFEAKAGRSYDIGANLSEQVWVADRETPNGTIELQLLTLPQDPGQVSAGP